jgi:hypothetical protein
MTRAIFSVPVQPGKVEVQALACLGGVEHAEA